MGRTLTRSVTLEMTQFARESVLEQASAQRVSIETLLRHAILHYLAERHSGRLAPQLPRFSRNAPLGDELVQLHVDLESDEWRTMEEEAEEAGVPLSRLLAHATMLYLADLDAGLVAKRLLDEG